MTHLRLRPVATSIAVILGASCSGAHVPPRLAAPEGALLTRTAPTAASELTFPPADADRSARGPVPLRFGPSAVSIVQVKEPALDAQKGFKLTGQTLRVVFNQAMDRGQGAPGAKKGEIVFPAPTALKVTPEVAGEIRWADERTLELTPAKPFADGVVYTVELGDVATPAGKKPEAPWKGSFTGAVSYVVAGKELGYVPKPGQERVIAVHPSEDARIGPWATLSVLYDQPIDLGLARSLLHLAGPAKTGIGFTVEHPRGPTFQGIKVDPRFVVLVRPVGSLPPGKTVKLTAADHTAARADRSADFDVVEPLRQTDVSCRWDYDDEPCSFSGGTLRTAGHAVHVLFNNSIDLQGKELESHVHLTPAVKNLAVRSEGWDGGQIIVSGDLSSSKTYDLRIDGVIDRYGQTLGTPVHVRVETMPQSASAAMPEGLILLDEATTKRFAVTTRNVAEAEIQAWPVGTTAPQDFQEALRKARARELPEGAAPLSIVVPVKADRDRSVDTMVDLSTKLAPGASYLATLKIRSFAFGSAPMKFPKGSEAERPPVALLGAGSPKTLAVQARSIPGATLVHVARLGSGEPVGGASVRFGGDDAPPAVSTDATGLALLPGMPAGATLLSVHGSDAELLLPLAGDGITAKQLFPGLGSGEDAGAGDRRAMVITDRGIYRPGSTAFIKASLRRADGAKLPGMAGATLQIHLVGPTGEDAMNEPVVANDLGSAAISFAVPADAKLGRYQLLVEDPGAPEHALAKTMIQVAEFEAPRFAVDVDVRATEAEAGRHPKPAELRALVHGRYLFGAPMDGASVKWTLKRSEARFPAGPLTEELSFRRRANWYDDEDGEDDDDTPKKGWSRAGEGRLAADGTLEVKQPMELDPSIGPQEFTLEADVADSSFRHIAGRAAKVLHPAKRYAGIKLQKGWIGVGETFPVELGVIDTEGRPVSGAKVTARLERVDWKYVERRGAGGALRWEWTPRRAEVGRCAATTATTAVSCSLTAAQGGDYEVSAEVDGKRGGARSFWAWRAGEESSPSPGRGKAVDIVTDKARYKPGDVARLLVRSPFAAATAILTVEQGGLLEHKSRRIEGGGALFEVPVTAAHAPWVHATVTLLPIGARGEAVADYRLGAVRLPVALDGARLDVALHADKESYEPGQEAEITIDVRDGAAPEAHAEIALAVVDEGVLRLTDFHAADPGALLRPGRALSFHLHDSRKGLAELFERSHTAGDGAGEGGHATINDTRKNFVETALWRPDLRTDDHGRATVKFKLPDNLTQFRMMAVVLDDEGKGAASESSFTVKKPVMLVPVVPRFAAVGDHFEAAAMLHNNTGEAVAAKVALTVGEGRPPEIAEVTVSAGGKSRVAFPLVAQALGEMKLSFAVAVGAGAALDRVEARVPVEEAGLDEHPHLQGAFARSQEVSLQVPEDARLGPEAAMTVQVGQHLWPELGERMEYLLGYPHGCVEQTTSSTLPLIAARAILPRIGLTRLSDGELKVRIKAGLDRLATMRTDSGGLAYWPGGSEPNVYGTAYAMRAVVLGKAAGVEGPKGLLDGMKDYLKGQLLGTDVPAEVRAAIAQSLAELGELPQGDADALQDRTGEVSVFGKASLALALHGLGGQEDRVAALLDEIEKSFDESGKLLTPPGNDDFYYYGSPTRTKAQAAIALTRLRPGARVLPLLLKELAESTESYTTQATAYSLLALGAHLEGEVAEGVRFEVKLDGQELEPSKDLGYGSREYRVPLASLRGKKATLSLGSDSDRALGFLISGRWRRPASSQASRAATSTPRGPEVYRVYTDARGGPVDLAHVHPGDVIRVALLADLPDGEGARERRGYLALTDRLPAGFEPIQPDLATVASVPDLRDEHPFAEVLRWGNTASHVELHDDRVDLYFDHVEGSEVAATYLVRASTPGEFSLPPASGELMYEGDSTGYTEGGRVVVQ